MAPTRLRQKNMGGSGENDSDPSCAQVESGVFWVQMFKKNVVHVFCFHFRHLFHGGEPIFRLEPLFVSMSSCLFHSKGKVWKKLNHVVLSGKRWNVHSLFLFVDDTAHFWDLSVIFSSGTVQSIRFLHRSRANHGSWWKHCHSECAFSNGQWHAEGW